MPFDGFRRIVALFLPQGPVVVPDLHTVSVPAMIYLLRHRELWPADFEWNYADMEACAMGLASRFWKRNLGATRSLAEAIGWTQNEVRHICLWLGDRNHYVTPEHVANAFEDQMQRRHRAKLS